MRETLYLKTRQFFFWFFFFVFIIFTPWAVFYSLGYKFDYGAKKFVKTGAISIKAYPRQVEVYLNNKKIKDSSPCVIRELLPGKYEIRLEKEGFLPYRINLEVRPSLVAEIDAVLLLEEKEAKEIDLDFEIFRFFVVKQILGEKIVAFTDKGIYLLDSEFKEEKKISQSSFSRETAAGIYEIRLASNKLVFWDKNNLWLVKWPEFLDFRLDLENPPQIIYRSSEDIKEVFFALKDRYLIVQEGKKVFALDVNNPQASFEIITLLSNAGCIFYSSRSETLYINDILNNKPHFFKIGLLPFIHERKDTQKNP